MPDKNEQVVLKRLLGGGNAAAVKRADRWSSKLIKQIQRHLSGQAQDFSHLPLDVEGIPLFHQRVYASAVKIPPGQTKTYGRIAAEMGSPFAARAVGQALGRNPFGLIVPCHRVVAAHGRPGGFSAFGGLATKEKLLSIEGIQLFPLAK